MASARECWVHVAAAQDVRLAFGPFRTPRQAGVLLGAFQTSLEGRSWCDRNAPGAGEVLVPAPVPGVDLDDDEVERQASERVLYEMIWSLEAAGQVRGVLGDQDVAPGYGPIAALVRDHDLRTPGADRLRETDRAWSIQARAMAHATAAETHRRAVATARGLGQQAPADPYPPELVPVAGGVDPLLLRGVGIAIGTGRLLRCMSPDDDVRELPFATALDTLVTLRARRGAEAGTTRDLQDTAQAFYTRLERADDTRREVLMDSMYAPVAAPPAAEAGVWVR